MASWSGFYGDTANTTGSYALQNDRGSILHRIKVALNKGGARRYKEQFDAALDASTGEATVKTYSRVEATADTDSNAQGGARTIESVNAMDNATITAAEEAEILAAAQFNPGHNLPVEDSAGNGGGGALTGRSAGA